MISNDRDSKHKGPGRSQPDTQDGLKPLSNFSLKEFLIGLTLSLIVSCLSFIILALRKGSQSLLMGLITGSTVSLYVTYILILQYESAFEFLSDFLT